MKQCANCMLVKADELFRKKQDDSPATKCLTCEQETGKTPNED